MTASVAFARRLGRRLEEARAFVVPFGKFHGHRLDEIAAFEPSYIDWLARAVQRDPDLTMAARVMQDDLDQRGIVRRTHPTPERPGRTDVALRRLSGKARSPSDTGGRPRRE